MAGDDGTRQGDATKLRDYLANERTLLSWVRLGLATSGFGFVVARFGLFLRELAVREHIRAPAPSGHLTEWIGILLVLGGPALVITAAIRYFRVEKAIDEGRHTRQYGLILVTIAASLVLGLVLAGYIFATGR